ncbi:MULTISPECIES: TadE/TadG family type IV pilus assembly protein [unclassified Frankia]|uniref:TadE/TadG family type IV pilus assembly protein n=1 Tax=unclassified Frankia TaxID=2632575 RepID=UPI0027DB175B|nr:MULTISPECIES: TadE/TadG family type IV pilus assembly protein [unclassified Frankia]
MTVEMVFVLPLVFTIVLLLAQVTVWAHASQIAQVTAARALAASRADGGSVAAGQTTAADTLAQLGQSSLVNPQVTITRAGAQATVHVHGTAASVLPWLHVGINADATGVIEQRAP